MHFFTDSHIIFAIYFVNVNNGTVFLAFLISTGLNLQRDNVQIVIFPS